MTTRDHDMIREGIAQVLRGLGRDVTSADIRDTPDRVARALLEMTSGVEMDPAALFATSFDSHKYDQMIVVKDITFESLCEHHMLPFSGVATIGYIPGPSNTVAGLSKFARLVDLYARRLQIQERLTCEIAEAMEKYLKPQGCGVRIESSHLCMANRGVRKSGAKMITSDLRGAFREAATRQEFLGFAGGVL